MSIGRLRQLQNAMASLCISANTQPGFANVQIRLAVFVDRYLGYATSYVTQLLNLINGFVSSYDDRHI